MSERKPLELLSHLVTPREGRAEIDKWTALLLPPLNELRTAQSRRAYLGPGAARIMGDAEASSLTLDATGQRGVRQNLIKLVNEPGRHRSPKQYRVGSDPTLDQPRTQQKL